MHEAYEPWEAAGQPGVLEDARRQVDRMLASYEPLPLDPLVERQIENIINRAEVES